MSPARRVAVLLALSLAPLTARAQEPPATDPAYVSNHPHFNDNGALRWSTKLADAQRAALAANRIIFVEYGRKGCVNCRQLCVDVLTNAKIRPRIQALAVGLAADCDKPESEVEKLIKDNLPGAQILPFAGFFTPELQWIAGWTGSTNADALLKVLDEVEKHALVQATPAVAKQLEALVATAQKAVDKEDWKAVLKAVRDAGRLRGRSALRTQLDGFAELAHAWGTAQLEAVVTALAAGGDAAEARKALNAIASRMGPEREADEVKVGLKAIERLVAIRGIEAGSTPDKAVGLRVKASVELKGTRWATLFQPR